MSFGAVRLGVDMSIGHDCFKPTQPATASVTVFTDQIPTVRQTDTYVPHCCPKKGCHAPMVIQGSQSAFCDQLAKHLVGHACNCGDKAGMGSMTTFAGF